MAIHTFYRVSHILPKALVDMLEAEKATKDDFQIEIIKTQLGHREAGSNHYSLDWEEWAEFYDEFDAIKCNSEMRRVITKWATIAIQAGY